MKITLPDRPQTYYLFWLFLFILCAVLFSVQAVMLDTQKEIISQNDPSYYYSYVRSMVIDRDLKLSNEYKHFNIAEKVSKKTGYPVNPYSIGFPLLVLPFFVIAHGVILMLNQIGFNLNDTGFSAPYQLSVSLGSMVYGYLGLVLCHRFARKFFPDRIVFLSVTTILLASNIFYYVIREPFMSHLASFFAVSLFIYSWYLLAEKGKWRDALIMGLAAGSMILVRQQDVVFLAVPVLDVLYRRVLKEKDHCYWTRPWNLSAFFLGLFSILSLQMVAWKMIYGSFITYSYGHIGETFIYATSPKIVPVLFSSNHGLISWNPVILLSLLGILLFFKYHRRMAFLFLCAFLFQLYVNASWFEWWFGNSFGHRAFISGTWIFIVGLACFIDRWNRAIPLVYLMAGFSILIAWNMVLILAYLSEMIPYAGTFSWVDLLSDLTSLPDQILKKIQSLR